MDKQAYIIELEKKIDNMSAEKLKLLIQAAKMANGKKKTDAVKCNGSVR